jgi:predicted anti-sigma-YlaC factor YlaD
MKLRLGCQEVSRLLSERQDHTMPAGDRARLRLHLVMCDACRTVEEQLEFLRLAMQRLGQAEPPVDEPPDPPTR